MNFTEPFYARPFVLVTPKHSDSNNNAIRPGSRCTAITAWVEVRHTSRDLCVNYGKRSGNGTDDDDDDDDDYDDKLYFSVKSSSWPYKAY